MYGYDIRQVSPTAPAASTRASLTPAAPWGCFQGRAGIRSGCPGRVCVPPRSWDQLQAVALMNVHVGFLSFASFHSHTNSFHQAQGDGGGGEGRGNYVWVLLFN